MSGVEVGVALSNVDHGGASVTADLDTRCGELYASGGEVLPAGQADSEDAGRGRGRRPPLGDSAGAAAFACSRNQFESLVTFWMERTLPVCRTRSLRSSLTVRVGSFSGGCWMIIWRCGRCASSALTRSSAMRA